ncbi:MAG TPA: neutral zinc metallopeptidase [Candidatus Limnocylindrales bacterium]
MTFRPGARLNPGEVIDERGSSGGGSSFGFPGGLGGGIGRGGFGRGGRGASVGAGGIGSIVLLLVVLGVFFVLNGGLGSTSGANDVVGPGSSDLSTCQTGADANAREDCRIVGYVDSIQAYWTDALPVIGTQYQDTQTVLFSGSYQTGCGQASTDTGPFYCAADKYVYLDLGFFNDLVTQLGGSDAPLAQAYVVAHEYGHHVQDLLGVLAQNQSSDTGPTSPSVRIELQADCYAGVWAANAVSTGYIEPLTADQIASAVSTAKAVGDDWIQRQSTGTVNPEQWTHGSSDERVRWFTNGYNGTGASDCDTFSTNNL